MKGILEAIIGSLLFIGVFFICNLMLSWFRWSREDSISKMYVIAVPLKNYPNLTVSIDFYISDGSYNSKILYVGLEGSNDDIRSKLDEVEWRTVREKINNFVINKQKEKGLY